MLLVVLFTAYSVLDNNRVESQASEENFASYGPAESNDPSFGELVAVNPDVVGWLTLYGTGIGHPLVQGQDNEKYLNANPKVRLRHDGGCHQRLPARRW
ncbi:hypothetical protein [Olsenella sp. Marseille-P4559]|uniref:hypothetical protein n=1 Tax=Olsenella sp. Marseille-P4559 TaxID=2364795 RepID=UPI0010321FBD|nr:hypothetical protein [Olsenella sp. Marseille-P4559]